MQDFQEYVQDYAKIFSHTEHRYRWDKQIEFALVMKDISEDVRAELIRTYEFLQVELGKGFLKSHRLGRRRLRHPILKMIENKTEWQITDLLRFTKALQKIKTDNDSNYPYLLSKLKSPIKCRQEGMPFIDIAYSLLNSGFNVSFQEESGTTKCADIVVFNPAVNERLYIEVSRLQESDDRKGKISNYHDLYALLHDTSPILPCSCMQLSYISESEMPTVRNTLAQLKNDALKQNIIVRYSDEKIDAAIAHPDKREQLKEWCKDNDRREWVTGLNLNFNETPRIIKNNMLKREATQIPPDSSGIIYIPLDSLYFMVTNLGDAVTRFGEAMSQFSNLLGVVLYSYVGAETKKVSILDNKHFYSRRMINCANYRDVFFVFNHSFNRRINEDTVNKIYASFESLDVTFL